MSISEGVLIAIITGIFSVLAVMLTNYQGQKRMQVLMHNNLEHKDKELELRLQAIEKKMDKHNNFVERLTIVETNQKNILHQIGDLKERM